MAFVDEYSNWGSRDGYGDSEEETLSFCDLPVAGNSEISAEWRSSIRDSSIEFLEREDFDFDFDLGRSISTEFHSCPADDLFHDGHLLPLTQSNTQISSSGSSSFGENRFLLNEKLQTWRSDSLDSRSSYWTSSSSNNSQASHRNFNYSASQKSFRHVNKSESKPRRTAASTSTKTKRWCTKKSLKWQQFFVVGFSNTPAMRLDDMRLRQKKTFKSRHIDDLKQNRNNISMEKSIVKQSVSWSSDVEHPGDLNFRLKSESVKGKGKGWMKFVTLMSLNGCMASVKSVINCTTVKKRIDVAGLSHKG